MNKSLQLYLRQIKLLIPIRTHSSKQFISELSNRINEYLDEHPNASFEDIQAQFGTPLEVSQSYLDSIDIEILIKQLSIAHIKKRLLTLTAIVLIAALCIFSVFTYKAYLHYKNTVITEAQTIIENND